MYCVIPEEQIHNPRQSLGTRPTSCPPELKPLVRLSCGFSTEKGQRIFHGPGSIFCVLFMKRTAIQEHWSRGVKAWYVRMLAHHDTPKPVSLHGPGQREMGLEEQMFALTENKCFLLPSCVCLLMVGR